MIESFEKRWQESSQADASPSLERLLGDVYREFVRDDVVLERLRSALVALLQYLVSHEGKTEANISTTDAFICLLTAERSDLQDRLPDDYQIVLDAIGLDLLEALHNPEMAAQFQATPEILLARARALSGNVH